MSIEFRLLGDVEVVVDGRPVPVGHSRQRCVLVAMLIDVNHVVGVDQLVDRVWADRPPGDVRKTLSGYVSRLRRLLAGAEVRLDHESGGYRLSVDPMAVDLYRFRRLLAEARDAEVSGDAYEKALSLWRGEAFAGVESPWLDTIRDSLGAERLAGELDRNDLALRQGRHVALVGELTLRAADYPWDERLAGQLMLALYRSGRQADALSWYHRLQRRLDDDLGAYPGARLQELHKQILTGDPALDGSPETAGLLIPRQLPSPAAAFAGRRCELDRLDAIAAAASQRSTAAVIAAVSGPAGVGKTALAVYWSHTVADQFPDGQLYVNLRGFDPYGTPVSAATALRGFLGALHVPPVQMPDALDEQTALYRSLMAKRRMLVVLDNARDAAHVRPLLPASAGSMVVVTSRIQLSGLAAAEGAHLITLDLFEPAEARELLARRLGLARVESEPEAVRQLIERCARLPLALSIVAARATVHPEFPLAGLAEQLRVALDALASGDPATDVRSVLSWSYAALSTPAARLFRLLGLHPGADIALPAAASLAGTSIDEVRRLLAELDRVQLVVEHSPGRFSSHDLLRAYEAELVGQDTDAERQAGLLRVFDHYLHTAYHASQVLHPTREPVDLQAPQPGVQIESFTDDNQAMAWFIAEHAALLGVATRAEAVGLDGHAQQMPLVLTTFFVLRGLWTDMVTTHAIALTAAERRADGSDTAHALRGIARASARLGDFDQANGYARRAHAVSRDGGDSGGQARAHLTLAEVNGRQGRYAEAISHAKRALSMYGALRHLPGQGRANNRIGWYHAQLGDYHQTLAACRKALALQRRTGDRLAQVATWDSLGFAHHHLGQHRRAITCFERGLRMSQDVGDRCNEAEILDHLGDAHRAVDEIGAARDAWQRSAAIFDAIGHPTAHEVRAKLRSADAR